jgi:hypothetical protein
LDLSVGSIAARCSLLLLLLLLTSAAAAAAAARCSLLLLLLVLLLVVLLLTSDIYAILHTTGAARKDAASTGTIPHLGQHLSLCAESDSARHGAFPPHVSSSWNEHYPAVRMS